MLVACARRAPAESLPVTCREAPVLALGNSVEYRFDRSHRVRVIRVEVTPRSAAERDLTKGDGEIGFRGARYGFEFHLYDSAGVEVDAGTSQACLDHRAKLPDVPGMYCLTLTPIARDEFPTAELDYAARFHGAGLVQMGDQQPDLQAICGR